MVESCKTDKKFLSSTHNMKKKNTTNIYLIGPLGAGKSSVGKCLAQLAQLDFYDSDHEVERLTGVDISWIFEVESEAGFRKREAETIATLTQLNHIVLSTGGGTIMNKTNRRLLRENGIVVYLQVSLDRQVKRTARKKQARPMLIIYNTREKLEQLNQIRNPLYEEIANLTYRTDDLSPHALALQILKDVEEYRKNETA